MDSHKVTSTAKNSVVVVVVVVVVSLIMVYRVTLFPILQFPIQ